MSTHVANMRARKITPPGCAHLRAERILRHLLLREGFFEATVVTVPRRHGEPKILAGVAADKLTETPV